MPVDISSDLSSAVLAAMSDATAAEVLPRWRALADHEVRTKAGPWDLVTDADVEAERVITSRLRDLVDVTVVGEEAVAAEADLINAVAGAACWLVDPVDGTRNFVDGKETFACMVALVDAGETVGAWITHPATGTVLSAARGQGAVVNGTAPAGPTPAHAGGPRGAIGARMHEPEGQAVLDRARTLGPAEPIRFCAGWDYFDLVTGATDYVSFTRTLPWDHAPGALIAREAGFRSARHDGDDYRPGDRRHGILSAAPAAWDEISGTLAVGSPANWP